MIVAIVTFKLPKPTTVAEITKTLLRKNYWLSEDGCRAGGIYLWETRADAERVYSADWQKMVTDKYGTPPSIEYLHSPVMVDNREGTISVAA